jgi:excisionase family DNA binding protein
VTFCDCSALGRTQGYRAITTGNRRLKESKLPELTAYLTAAEAAEVLGCCPTSVRRWCAIGVLPCKRLGRTGRTIRIARSALESFET